MSMDSHHTNWRYLRWKYGAAPDEYRWSMHLLMVDLDFQNSLRGKTLSQLKRWFPDAGEPKTGTYVSEWIEISRTNQQKVQNGDPNMYYKATGGDMEYVLELRDGKLIDIYPMKG